MFHNREAPEEIPSKLYRSTIGCEKIKIAIKSLGLDDLKPFNNLLDAIICTRIPYRYCYLNETIFQDILLTINHILDHLKKIDIGPNIKN